MVGTWWLITEAWIPDGNVVGPTDQRSQIKTVDIALRHSLACSRTTPCSPLVAGCAEMDTIITPAAILLPTFNLICSFSRLAKIAI